MPEINYEKEYDNRARVPEHPQIFARWATDAESYRASLSGPQVERVNYGPTTREVIDLFDARPGAPLAVFIHGGWWTPGRAIRSGALGHRPSERLASGPPARGGFAGGMATVG